MNIMFDGPTVFQKRNYHNLEKDFKDEVSMYMNNKKIYEILKKLKLKRGIKNFDKNLLSCYKILIKNSFFQKNEIVFLKAWLTDCKNLKLI